MKKVKVENLETMKKFAATVADKLRGGEVIGLVGDLGAGKTTFVQALAEALGVTSKVKSPTFILLQSFETGRHVGPRRLCHVDAYRLKDWTELEAIGFEDFVADKKTVSVVEWADRVPELHRFSEYAEVVFSVEKDDERVLTLQGEFFGGNKK